MGVITVDVRLSCVFVCIFSHYQPLNKQQQVCVYECVRKSEKLIHQQINLD